MLPTPTTMKKTILLSAGLLALSGISQAAITITGYYPFGESGSLGTGNVPLDTVGTNSATVLFGDPGTAVTGPGGNAGSTAYLDTSNAAAGGYHGTNFGYLPTDNYAFSIYASANAAGGGNTGNIMSIGTNGAYCFDFGSNGWGASFVGVQWISQVGGVSGSFTPNTWTHLALVRQNGLTTFYIDGISAGTTAADSGNKGNGHFSVHPGASFSFDGLLDEARVVTFSSTDSTADILTTLQTGAIVPEASSALLGAFGCLALLRRRRA